MIYISTYSPKEKSPKKEHELGRKLLDFALAKEYGISLHNISIETEEKGKPYLKDCPWIHFNISHTNGMVVCAVHDLPVGVDVEEIRPYSDALVRKVLTASERETLRRWESRGHHFGEVCFLRHWTLKESYVKATGEGLSKPFGELEFRLDKEEQIESNCPDYDFYQRCLWNQYIVSVCVKKGGFNQMTYESVFEEIKKIFMCADVSGIKEHLAYQFNITGEAEGIFYAEVSEGTLSVEPYDYQDRDAMFICTADTLLGIAKGKLDPVAAFTLGKLKVEGSIEKALLIQKFLKK